jgi:hypothetical protein
LCRFLAWVQRFHWSIARASVRCRFSCPGFGDFEVETSGRYTFREQNVLLVLGSSLSSKLNDFLADVIHANVFSRVVHLALGQ